MDIETRIAQFEKMANDDPTNDMAHFSLGGAYKQAMRYADAAKCYDRCVELNPTMSKAYQLAGECHLAAGDEAKAGEVLAEGYTVAAERGDLMPKNAIAELMEKLGIALPEVDESKAPDIPEGSFIDRKTSRPGTQLAAAPFRGPLGAWIYHNVSSQTWDEWIGQGTKVINELRLDLSRDEDAEAYDRYMREFL
ncbi:MAG: Fe(2+)-trafficking protein, partial [Planctomycetota bacterium]